jgi:hypothetical protein
MDTVAPTIPRLTPSTIAKDWAARGHLVSRQYVDKLMRKGAGGEKLEGKHAETLEAAWLWRTARTDFLKSAKGGGGAAPSLPGVSAFPPSGPGPSKPVVGDTSLDALLERVRGVEMQAFVRWSNATGYDQAAEAKAYEAASKVRISAEGLVAAHHKKLGLVVDLADAQVLIDMRLNPIRGMLQTLDRELAKEFYPEEPAKHRPRFRRVIARLSVASLAIARAKKRLHPALSSHGSARAA